MDLPTDHQARKALGRPFKEWKPPRGAPRRDDDGTAPLPSAPSPAGAPAGGDDNLPTPGTKRRTLYDAVAASEHLVDMDQLAEVAGVPRDAVASHMTPLVNLGLVVRHRGEWTRKRKVVLFGLAGRSYPDAPAAERAGHAPPPTPVARPPAPKPLPAAPTAAAGPSERLAAVAAASQRETAPLPRLPDAGRSVAVLERLAAITAEDIADELHRVARFIRNTHR